MWKCSTLVDDWVWTREDKNAPLIIMSASSEAAIQLIYSLSSLQSWYWHSWVNIGVTGAANAWTIIKYCKFNKTNRSLSTSSQRQLDLLFALSGPNRKVVIRWSGRLRVFTENKRDLIFEGMVSLFWSFQYYNKLKGAARELKAISLSNIVSLNIFLKNSYW